MVISTGYILAGADMPQDLRAAEVISITEIGVPAFGFAMGSNFIRLGRSLGVAGYKIASASGLADADERPPRRVKLTTPV